MALAGATTLLGAPQASGATATFGWTGGEQTFTVPAGVTSVYIFATGGAGGNSGTSGNVKWGGGSHDVEADVPVTPGQVLYVQVGGYGGHGTSTAGGTGGFNGGGFAAGPGAGGGGGASDVRTISRHLPGTLNSRLLVAGGGGGGATGDGPCGETRWSSADCMGRGGHAGQPGSRGWGRPGCIAGEGGGPGRQDGGGWGGLGGNGGGKPNADPGQSGHFGGGGNGGRLDLSGGGGGGGYFGGGGGGAGRLFTDPLCFSWPGGGGGGSWYFHPTSTETFGPEHCPWAACVPEVMIEYSSPPPPPVSSEFSFGKPKLNKRKGTAKLPVKVPGGGALKLARSKKVKGAVGTAAGAGTVKLSVVPRGAAKRRLQKRGKATVRAAVTFSPADGEPRTKTKSLRLVKR